MRLSIVIPAYNEENTIGKVVKQLIKYYPKAEIIVVNDCSTDKTLSILKEYKIRILTNKKNRGHAYSVIRGLNAARGTYVLYMDADNQIRNRLYDFNFYLYKDFDLVSGYRVNRQDKLFRKIVSLILKIIIYIRHGYWIRDANCPYKLFKNKMLKFLLMRFSEENVVPSITLEILFRRYKMKTLEIPVMHYPYVRERKGALQSLNKKSLSMFFKAFKEVWYV